MSLSLPNKAHGYILYGGGLAAVSSTGGAHCEIPTTHCRVLLGGILAAFYALAALSIRPLVLEATQQPLTPWPGMGWCFAMGAALLWLVTGICSCCESLPSLPPVAIHAAGAVVSGAYLHLHPNPGVQQGNAKVFVAAFLPMLETPAGCSSEAPRCPAQASLGRGWWCT